MCPLPSRIFFLNLLKPQIELLSQTENKERKISEYLQEILFPMFAVKKAGLTLRQGDEEKARWPSPRAWRESLCVRVQSRKQEGRNKQSSSHESRAPARPLPYSFISLVVRFRSLKLRSRRTALGLSPTTNRLYFESFKIWGLLSEGGPPFFMPIPPSDTN